MGCEAVWPLFGLRLESRSLTLRCATETDVGRLAKMLPPDLEVDPSLPHHRGFSDVEQRAAGELQQYWRNLGSWTAESWKLPFVVEADGAMIGVQTLEANDFTKLRVVDSASWLVAEARGRGRGREMRAAVLHLAFAGLGADFAVSSAWHDNHASLGVSRSLGYVDNGVELQARGNRVDRLQRMILTAERWREVVRPDVTVVGLDESLVLFGLT
jgi:RimJ/RimL family protein N-acetyltransferase